MPGASSARPGVGEERAGERVSGAASARAGVGEEIAGERGSGVSSARAGVGEERAGERVSGASSARLRFISRIRAALSCFLFLLDHALLLVSDIVVDSWINQRNSREKSSVFLTVAI